MTKTNQRENKRKNVATNKQAYFRYFIEDRDKFEAGLVLVGSEIKSIRAGNVTLTDAFVEERGSEMWLMNVHIAAYKEASKFGHAPLRPRKLLLKQREIRELTGRVREKGYTIVPIQLYLNEKGRAKIEIALAKGKKDHDKRHTIAERDNERNLRRVVKSGRYED
jgi:SsrA-binding protein